MIIMVYTTKKNMAISGMVYYCSKCLPVFFLIFVLYDFWKTWDFSIGSIGLVYHADFPLSVWTQQGGDCLALVWTGKKFIPRENW